jgi:stage III sporulation protein AD
MDIFKLSGIAVVTAVLSLTVRNVRPELGLQTAIAGGAVLAAAAFYGLLDISEAISEAASSIGLDGDIPGFVLRVTGVAYASQLAADICRDANENALASKTETCGRIAILALALPRLTKLIGTVASLIGECL